MSSYACVRFAKIKSRIDLCDAVRHNRREGIIDAHVDKSRISLNRRRGDAILAFDAATAGKKMRKNGVLAVEAVMSFSPEMKDKVDIQVWALRNYEWVTRKFGKENILEVNLHMDEKTPHLHILFLPRDKNKKWNWRGLVEGRAGARAIQTEYADAMQEFGLNRGVPKKDKKHIPPKIHRMMEELKAKMEKEKKAEKQELLDEIRGFLGEPKFQSFLSWAKQSKETKKDIKDFMDMF